MKGSDVKKILRACGYTQTSVAKTIGTTPKALNEALNAENIKIELLKRIAKAIGKDVSFFFNDGKTDSKQIEQVNAVYKKTLKLYAATLKLSENINRKLVLLNKQQVNPHRKEIAYNDSK